MKASHAMRAAAKVRSQNTSTADTVTSMNTVNAAGGRHGRGGGRRQRFFGHGELRLVILDILSRDDSHGYELIKAIENLTQGNYTPSPGVIYPTLDFLQEQSLITIREEEGGKKQDCADRTRRAVAGRKPRTGRDD